MLKSKNLYFRELNLEDVNQNYINWLNDPEINQFLESRHTKQTIDTCKKYVKENSESKNNYLFGIFTNHSSQHVGNIKLTISHPREQIAELGLIIGEKKYQGKGFAIESINRITNFALDDLDIKRIQAGFYDVSLKSLNCFLKCGYSIDGYLKNHWLHNNKRVGRILVSKINE